MLTLEFWGIGQSIPKHMSIHGSTATRTGVEIAMDTIGSSLALRINFRMQFEKEHLALLTCSTIVRNDLSVGYVVAYLLEC